MVLLIQLGNLACSVNGNFKVRRYYYGIEVGLAVWRYFYGSMLVLRWYGIFFGIYDVYFRYCGCFGSPSIVMAVLSRYGCTFSEVPPYFSGYEVVLRILFDGTFLVIRYILFSNEDYAFSRRR